MGSTQNLEGRNVRAFDDIITVKELKELLTNFPPEMDNCNIIIPTDNKGIYTVFCCIAPDIRGVPEHTWRGNLFPNSQDGGFMMWVRPKQLADNYPPSTVKKSTRNLFIEKVGVNIENDQMSDTEFRQFVRGTLPTSDYESLAAKK